MLGSIPSGGCALLDELVFHEATKFGPCWARKLVQATFVKEEWMALLANVHTELHVEAATLLVFHEATEFGPWWARKLARRLG